MEFRDYAAKETSGLLGRLIAGHTQASLQHLNLLRDALDATARGIEAETASAQAEQEIQELIRRLNAAAGTAARAASQKVQKESQALIDAANDELKAQKTETERLTAEAAAARQDLESQIDAIRADLQRETERAESIDKDLDAAIEAHAQVDAARQEAESSLRQQTQGRAAAESDLAEMRSLLDETVADAARLSSEIDAVRAQLADAHASLATAQRQAAEAQQESSAALDSARRAIDAGREQHDQLANALAEAQAQADMLRADLSETQASIEALRGDVARETERADGADRDLDAAIEAHAAVDAARLEAEEATRVQAQARAAIEKELADVRAQIDGALAQTGRATMQLEGALAENRTLTADVAAAQAELEAARTQREAFAAQLEASRNRVQILERNQGSHDESLQRLEQGLNEALQAEASARELAAGVDADIAAAHAELADMRSSVDRLNVLFDASIHSVDELAAASTMSDLQASLVRQLSSEFSRVALFRLKGNRLEGEYQIGFDDTTDVSKIVLPVNMDSLITRAASSGVAEHLQGHELDDSSRAPFGGTPTMAMALPVVFQGETMSVIYADSDLQENASHHDASAAYARLMVRTTCVLMNQLSQELRTLNELREYAAMLLQEAEEMYSADVETGRTEEERRSRLKDTVECARQLYAQRAALEGAAAASLLDDRIAAAIQAEPATPFSTDLSAVVSLEELTDESRHTAAS
jgi:chromosome segregation ATPase